MLDKLMKTVSHLTNKHDADTAALRARVERERAGDHARQHAGREFQNPEGHTTPLRRNAENAQVAYARARKAFEKDNGLSALANYMAMEIARQRRDEAAAALKKHEAEEAQRLATGVHKEVAAFFALLFGDGVEPRHLANISEDVRVIISDLIRWDGYDWDRLDPESPVPQVVAIYRHRAKVRPGREGHKTRSQPREVGNADPNLYRFGDNGAGPANRLLDDRQAFDEPQATRTAEVVTAEIDPYALSAAVSPRTVELFTELATSQVATDSDWDLGIRLASNGYDDRRNVKDTIEVLEGMRQPDWVTPFAFFIDTARRDGLAAGRAAYREATIRRTAMQMATEYGVAPVLGNAA